MSYDLEDRLRDLASGVGMPSETATAAAEARVMGSLARPPRRRRPSTLLIGIALLVPIAIAVLIVVGRQVGTSTDRLATPTTTAVVAPALAEQMVGNWMLEGVENDGSLRPETPLVSFFADGTWAGSDGCNGIGAKWRLDEDVFHTTDYFSHLVGCHNVPYKEIFVDGATVAIAGDRMTVRDPRGVSPVAQVLVRTDALPTPPARGWLPGYSSFTPDRVVTDPTLLARFVRIAKNLPVGNPTAPSDRIVVWRPERFDGLDQYLVAVKGSEMVCHVSLVVATGKGGGAGCETRSHLTDHLDISGGGKTFLVADDVRSVTLTGDDGTSAAMMIRNNFALGSLHVPVVSFTVVLNDGRMRTRSLVKVDAGAQPGRQGVVDSGGVALPDIAALPGAELGIHAGLPASTPIEIAKVPATLLADGGPIAAAGALPIVTAAVYEEGGVRAAADLRLESGVRVIVEAPSVKAVKRGFATSVNLAYEHDCSTCTRIAHPSIDAVTTITYAESAAGTFVGWRVGTRAYLAAAPPGVLTLDTAKQLIRQTVG